MATETDGTVVVIAPGAETEAEHEGDAVAEGVEIAETIIETARELQNDDRRVELSLGDLRQAIDDRMDALARGHNEILSRLDGLGNLVTSAALATIETVEEVGDEVADEERDEMAEEAIEEVVEEVVDEVAEELEDAPEKRTRKRRFV
jgi:uncharacterized protein YgfB (UPF0149 family)